MPANFVVYFRPLSCTNLEFPDNLGQLSRFARDVRTRIYILRRGSKKGHIQIWKYPRINDLVYFGKFRSPIGDSKKKKTSEWRNIVACDQNGQSLRMNIFCAACFSRCRPPFEEFRWNRSFRGQNAPGSDHQSAGRRSERIEEREEVDGLNRWPWRAESPLRAKWSTFQGPSKSRSHGRPNCSRARRSQ